MPTTQTLAWTVLNADGKPAFKCEDGYMMVWLMQDWPLQIQHSNPTMNLRVVSGSAILDNVKHMTKGKRRIRGAAAPYLIPTTDWQR